MAAIFSTILNVIRSVGKPIANVVNGIIQSLDDRQGGVNDVMRRMTLLSGTPCAITKGDMSARPLDSRGLVRVLDDASPEEKEVAAAIYAAEQARNMNVMLNEIPFYADTEYSVTLSQSIAITVPSGLSVVQRLFLSPLMNLGGRLVNLARQYRVMRVDAVMLGIMQQNEVYSTIQLAYNPVVSLLDIREMVTDLEAFYADQAALPVGTRTHYFYTDSTREPGTETVNGVSVAVGRFGTYAAFVNKIKELPVTGEAYALPESTLGVNQPGMVLVPMRNDIAANPVYHPGMEYVGLYYAENYVSDTGAHMSRADALSMMPTYGTYYYTLSNAFDKPVDQILTVKYVITCKQRIDGSTYTDPDAEPII